MKKIIFLFALIAIALGCQQKEKNISQKSVDSKKLSELITKEEERWRVGCNNILVVDLDRIPAANLAKWLDKNKKYSCSKKLVKSTAKCYNTEVCSTNLIVIDLELVKNPLNDKDDEANIAERAKWLNTNGSFICFDQTYPYYLDSHEITSTTLQEEMVKFPHYDITFTKLKADIEKQVKAGYFAEDAYQKYVNITVSKGVVDAKVINQFMGSSCFSIPFLRSIERLFCPDDTVIVEVYPFVNNGAFCTGFKVHTVPTGTNDVYFLNYSTDPK